MTELHVPSWARRGADVVCVSEDWGEIPAWFPIPTRTPMLNEVLTIADVFCDDAGRIEVNGLVMRSPATVSLTFAEVPVLQEATFGSAHAKGTIHWPVSNFRPLLRQRRSRRADIALFNPVHHREDA